MIDKYRIELVSKKELKYLLKLVTQSTVKKKNLKIHKRLLEAIEDKKFIPINPKKLNAIKLATISRSETVKKKIQKALSLLERKKIQPTIANVATTADIGYNTSKKYAHMFEYGKK
jgi:hypothetical protein